MNPVILGVGAVVAYMYFMKGQSPANTGGKPRTNVYASGKDYAMNRDNYSIANGFVPTKAIGILGTPKQLIYDRAGVLHEHYLPKQPTAGGCACHH